VYNKGPGAGFEFPPGGSGGGSC